MKRTDNIYLYTTIYLGKEGSAEAEWSIVQEYSFVCTHKKLSFTFIILEDIFFVIFWITIFCRKPNSIRSSLQTVASLKACNKIFLTSSLLMMFLFCDGEKLRFCWREFYRKNIETLIASSEVMHIKRDSKWRRFLNNIRLLAKQFQQTKVA